jgi:hypothetical protein
LKEAELLNYLYVAQIDGDTVVAVSMLKKSGFVKTDNQVIIRSLDESLLGKRYNSESETFEAKEG